MKNEPFDCWKCGAALGRYLSLPIGRSDRCPNCRAELCVCRLCHFYDPAVADQCREPIAERVSNKECANFCGYFQLNPHAYVSNSKEQAAAQSQLNALFDEEAKSRSVSGDTANTPSADAQAKAMLEQLFSK